MIRSLVDTTAAELAKLRSLPVMLAAMLGTVGAAIALTAAIAASSSAATNAVQVTFQTIPFLQIGPILIGVLAAATEYAGNQIRATLAATPDRPLLLTGKTLAYLSTVAITGAAALGAGLITATITLALRDHAMAGDTNGWTIAGAGAYLVLIGLLGFALTVLLRSLVPPLVAMLSLVLIVSPLLDGFTEYAHYLPDRAGSLLYLPGPDTPLTPGIGALTLLAWITATAAAAVIAFTARDA